MSDAVTTQRSTVRFHYLQHVPFEDAANIGVWARQRGFVITCTRLYAGETLPDVADIDWLAIMGGPMNIYEENRYPWLTAERAWIKQVIEARKTVIGVCLGAQLLADALGAPIIRNAHTEIGWFPVTLTEEGRRDSLLSALPATFEAFHWHGDTFAMPPGARHLAESAACAHQVFQYGDRVLGLQCHLDYSRASIEAMIKNCADELVAAAYVQTDPEVLTDIQRTRALEGLLYTALDAMAVCVISS